MIRPVWAVDKDAAVLVMVMVWCQVSVWAIPEQRVLDSADVHEMVTSAAWLPPDGRRVAVATLKGKVRFFGADEHGQLEYEAQVGAHPSSHPTTLLAGCPPSPFTLYGH